MAASDYVRIEKAIRYLDANFRKQPTLSEIAAQVHLSEYHFQRLFRRWAGVTPKRFLQYLTAEHSRRLLRESRSVLEVSDASGLSSAGRLHDLLVGLHAVTPGELKTQGAILHLQPRATRPMAARIFAAPHTAAKHCDLFVQGSNFQVKVWEALLRIPPGHVVAYEDIAARIEAPTATRAVASAIARNPIAFLVPCHRVIRKTGAFGEYRWGSARKQAILGWEAAQRESDDTAR